MSKFQATNGLVQHFNLLLNASECMKYKPYHNYNEKKDNLIKKQTLLSIIYLLNKIFVENY